METIIITASVTLFAIAIFWAYCDQKEETREFLKPMDIIEPQTKCETCGAYIDKINKVNIWDINKVNIWDGVLELTTYYCGTCKKPYTKKHVLYYGADKYFGEVEMSEDGTPVGYKKIK